MGELSNRSSRQPLLQADDSTSLTSFPDPATGALPQESQTSSQPLSALLDQSGPSIFDENQNVDATDPQSLSAAPSSTLQHIIDHHGAVDLVRRLSSALAQRDAHITALIRLAEDYKVPQELIGEASKRARQMEDRRVSLAQASETLQDSNGTPSDSGVGILVSSDMSAVSIADHQKFVQSSYAVPLTKEGQAASNGITRLFGGAGKTKP